MAHPYTGKSPRRERQQELPEEPVDVEMESAEETSLAPQVRTLELLLEPHKHEKRLPKGEGIPEPAYQVPIFSEKFVHSILGDMQILASDLQGAQGTAFIANADGQDYLVKVYNDPFRAGDLLRQLPKLQQFSASYPDSNILMPIGVFGGKYKIHGREIVDMRSLTPYIDAPNLHTVLTRAQGNTSDELQKQVLGSVARELYLLHSEGMSHRDIKPSNILVGDKIYLTDIDSMTTRTDATTGTRGQVTFGNMTAEIAFMGTPEQYDLCQFGMLALRLWTGINPLELVSSEHGARPYLDLSDMRLRNAVDQIQHPRRRAFVEKVLRHSTIHRDAKQMLPELEAVLDLDPIEIRQLPAQTTALAVREETKPELSYQLHGTSELMRHAEGVTFKDQIAFEVRYRTSVIRDAQHIQDLVPTHFSGWYTRPGTEHQPFEERSESGKIIAIKDTMDAYNQRIADFAYEFTRDGLDKVIEASLISRLRMFTDELGDSRYYRDFYISKRAEALKKILGNSSHVAPQVETDDYEVMTKRQFRKMTNDFVDPEKYARAFQSRIKGLVFGSDYAESPHSIDAQVLQQYGQLLQKLPNHESVNAALNAVIDRRVNTAVRHASIKYSHITNRYGNQGGMMVFGYMCAAGLAPSLTWALVGAGAGALLTPFVNKLRTRINELLDEDDGYKRELPSTAQVYLFGALPQQRALEAPEERVPTVDSIARAIAPNEARIDGRAYISRGGKIELITENKKPMGDNPPGPPKPRYRTD